MFMKILAASALTVGLATSAMAQSADGGGSGKSVVVTPDPADPNAVDPSATYSTNGMNGALNSMPMKTVPPARRAHSLTPAPGRLELCRQR